MKIYVTNPGATSECLVIPEKFKLVNRWGLDVSDSFTFTSKTKTIVPGASIRVLNDHDRCVFRGMVLSHSGDYASDVWQWNCLHRVGIAKRRYMHPITYSSALTLSEVLSSNPPSQSAGDDQYIPGVIWSLNSELPYGTGDAGSDGIITIAGFGSANTGSVAVYYDGHLCTQASSLGDVDSSSYRYYQDTTTLYVYGTGSGDVYGQIGLSNLFDSGLRLGAIDNDDNLMAALKIKNNNIVWKVISELVEDHSQYLSLRDQTYLDITTTKQGRGAFDDPIYTIRDSEILSFQRLKDNTPPANAVIGIGAGEGLLSGARYTRATVRKGAAWIEDLITVEDSYIAPFGILDEKIDFAYESEIDSNASVKITTKLDYILPGDVPRLDLTTEDMTLRVQTVAVTESNIFEVQLGPRNLEIDEIFLNKDRTLDKDYRIDAQADELISSTHSLMSTNVHAHLRMVHIREVWGLNDDYGVRMAISVGSDILIVEYLFFYPGWTTFEYNYWKQDVNGCIIDICHYGNGSTSIFAIIDNNYVKKIDVTTGETLASYTAGPDDNFVTLCRADSSGIIYVVSYKEDSTTDAVYCCIYKLNDSDLSYISSDGGSYVSPTSAPFRNPIGCSADDTYLYICDTENHRVKKYLASDLSYVSQQGSCGSGSLQLDTPTACWINQDDATELYIADTKNNRYLIWNPTDWSYVGSSQLDEKCLAVDRLQYTLANKPVIMEFPSMNWSVDNMILDDNTNWIKALVNWIADIQFVISNYDDGIILLDLDCTSTSSDYGDMAADYTIYINGEPCIILHNCKWGPGQILEGVDITDYCLTDGSTNEVYVIARWRFDETDTLDFTLTIRADGISEV